MTEKTLRKHLQMTETACGLLPELAKAMGVPQGQAVSLLIVEEAARRKGELSAVNDAHRTYLAANAVSKMCAALLDMFNSYLHVFEGTATAEQFRAFDDDPHPWAQKAAEVEEYRRRKANFNKLKNPSVRMKRAESAQDADK